jgi:hypothetical protein
MKKKIIILVAVVLFLLGAIAVIAGINRSGCCSYHDGVCGCSGGRTVCCDGTISPSCGCD